MHAPTFDRLIMIRTTLTAATFAVLTLSASFAETGKVVNVYNWNDYIDETTLADFTKETGIKVNYDIFDSNEVVMTKMLTGNSGYDVITPSMYIHAKLIKTKAVGPLDKAKIPNLAGIPVDFMKNLATDDPGNAHSVPYMWAPNAIGVNVAEVEKRIGKPIPASLDLLLKPELSDKIADCGIAILDSPDDILSMTLKYLGKDPNSNDEADFKAAMDVLAPVRKNIRRFTSGDYIGPLANGDICMAVGYGGDLFQSKSRAEEAKNGIVIDVLLPNEGTAVAIDAFAIPSDAKNVDEAHAFINFMSRPDIAARNSNYTSFATPVEAAKANITPEIVNNPAIYPTAEVLAKTFVVVPKEVADQRRLTRIWTRYKSQK
jgi:putrescine transport system substrate-binding protein